MGLSIQTSRNACRILARVGAGTIRGQQVSFVHNLNQLRQLLIFIIMMCYYKAYLGTKTTTTMQEQSHQQAFLEELDARQFDYCINRNRKLHLLRSLPADMAVRLPRSLIPTPILQLHQQYKQGTLDKELVGGPKYHDKIKLLRRYRLVAPPTRRSADEKRTRNRENLKRWRQRHSRPCQGDTSRMVRLMHTGKD